MLWTYRWRLHLTFPQTAQLWPRGNNSCSCRCWRKPNQALILNQLFSVRTLNPGKHDSDSHRNQYDTGLSAGRERCVTYFLPGLYGEEDVWEEGLWSDGAVESDDTSQERPEDHQDVNIPAKASLSLAIKTQRSTVQIKHKEIVFSV